MPSELKDAVEVTKIVLEVGRLVTEVGHLVLEAIESGDVPRVQEVMPDTLRMTLVRAKAELEAAKKFGPRP